jgi:catechol 2,3-dioxygenase-like lactoylglutathione lyase family enzyme
MAELPPTPEGILLGYFIVSDDVERSRRFYTEVLGGRVLFSGTPTVVALSNSWIVINSGGGPTDDKRRSPWRRRVIWTGSAASSISGSKTSRPCTPNGVLGVLNS